MASADVDNMCYLDVKKACNVVYIILKNVDLLPHVPGRMRKRLEVIIFKVWCLERYNSGR